MTKLLFVVIFFTAFGYGVGKLFARTNPIKLFLGIVFLLGSLAAFSTLEGQLDYGIWCYGIGFLIGWGSSMVYVLRIILIPFQSVFMWVGGWFSLDKVVKKASENLNQEKTKAEEDLEQQRKRAEEALRRQAEEVRREREKFRKEQEKANKEQAKRNQQSSSSQDRGGYKSSSDSDKKRGSENTGSSNSSNQNQSSNSSSQESLNPNNLKDAYEILGVTPEMSLVEIKKAYRRLMGLYHPDRINNLAGSRRARAEQEARQINLAWDRVKREKK